MPEQRSDTGNNLPIELIGDKLWNIVEKFGHYTSEKTRKTDKVIIPFQDAEATSMKKLYIKQTDMHSFVIYESQGDTDYPMYSFSCSWNDVIVYSIHNTMIEDPEELERAIALVCEIDDALQFVTEARLDAFDARSAAINGLQTAIENKKRDLERLERLLNKVESREEQYMAFSIVIVDSWEGPGGKSISQVFLADSLRNAIQAAVDEFKRINNRSDVQYSQFTVSVHDGVEQVLEVPYEVIKPFVQAVTKSDRVADAQMYAK